MVYIHTYIVRCLSSLGFEEQLIDLGFRPGYIGTNVRLVALQEERRPRGLCVTQQTETAHALFTPFLIFTGWLLVGHQKLWIKEQPGVEPDQKSVDKKLSLDFPFR